MARRGAELIFFAPCAEGLERLLAAEVAGAGGLRVRAIRGGVRFFGQLEMGYALCLWSRVATTVRQELQRGPCPDTGSLYGFTRAVEWARVLDPTHRFVVTVVSDDAGLHARYATQRVESAILDAVADRSGRRPTVDRAVHDVSLRLEVSGGQATLWRDLAGAPLDRRDWRPQHVAARMSDALAAGLVLLSGWDRERPLLDPMCVDGAVAIEAAHLAGDRAPGLRRAFAFEGWPDLAAAAWNSQRDAAEERAAKRGAMPPVTLANPDPGAAGIAGDNAVRAEVADDIHVLLEAPTRLPPLPDGWIVTNPPWSPRAPRRRELIQAWEDLGAYVRRSGAAQAWVLSANRVLTRHLGLPHSTSLPLRNGALPCSFHQLALPEAPA